MLLKTASWTKKLHSSKLFISFAFMINVHIQYIFLNAKIKILTTGQNYHQFQLNLLMKCLFCEEYYSNH